jgi:hypothetical protein
MLYRESRAGSAAVAFRLQVLHVLQWPYPISLHAAYVTTTQLLVHAVNGCLIGGVRRHKSH